MTDLEKLQAQIDLVNSKCDLTHDFVMSLAEKLGVTASQLLQLSEMVLRLAGKV